MRGCHFNFLYSLIGHFYWSDSLEVRTAELSEEYLKEEEKEKYQKLYIILGKKQETKHMTCIVVVECVLSLLHWKKKKARAVFTNTLH